MIDVLLGGVFGGLLRLAPEVLGFIDKKNERDHEIAMLDREMDFAKIRGDIAMKQTEATMQIAELDAIGKAFQEQSATAANAGWFVSALSALVRPMITYVYVGSYFAVKAATFTLAITQDGRWNEVVLSLWTKDDVTIMFMIISFWFVGRVWDKTKR